MTSGAVCPHEVEAEYLRGEMARLQRRVTELETELAAIKRLVFGRKSEKLPPVEQQLRGKSTRTPEEREQTKRKRAERASQKQQLPVRRIEHKVPPEQRCCPSCGSSDLRALGPGKVTSLYERLTEKFERQEHVQEVLTCKCGEGIVTAAPPERVYDKSQHGPELIAHAVVSKCADSTPLYRQAKMYARHGVPMSRSTLGDLFHRAAEVTEPLTKRLLELVARSEIVQADETPLKVLAKNKTRQGWLWTFLTDHEQPLISYVFSPSRSGETPTRVLGTSEGTLVVDAYSGYNRVTIPGGRQRSGCLAHVRRKFFEALPSAPAAQEALEQILDVYRVEHEAKKLGIVRSKAHLEMRKQVSHPRMEKFRAWLEEQRPQHLPQGPMGGAIGYALNQWEELTRFLEDVRLPLDNNASERALRVVALGRKNFLFVGNDAAGCNLAGLYSLVMTCEANGINPIEYLKDVLLRVQTHPNSKLDELLPAQWAGLRANQP